MYLASATDIGKKRDENQDSVFAQFIGDNIAFASVCDGMGGAASGSVASKLAIDALSGRVLENFRPDMKDNSLRNLLLSSVHTANTVVYEKSREDIDTNGMGTTCVGALVIGKRIYVVNVGDSRAYLLNSEGISQITTDHTYVQMLYQSGQITKEEAEHHQRKNIITRAVGVEPDVEVDYFELDEEEGNFAVLLCSDGLSNYCSEEMLREFVYEKNLDQAVADLIAYANEQGGRDNISVAIIAN